jgi:hypothetical protein
MKLSVGQAFQPAGLRDFPVPWTKNGRLESRPNPQARKPALRTSPVHGPDACGENARRLSMQRGVESGCMPYWIIR